MSFEYLDNSFIKGIVSDNAPQQQSPQSVRDAVNMDFAELGKSISYTPINGTTNLYNLGNNTANKIIGVNACNGKINFEIVQGFILFIQGAVDYIVFHSVKTDYYTVLISGDLGFTTDSLIDGFAFTELTQPKFYFTDNINELRVVVVDDSYTNTLTTLPIAPKAVTQLTISNNIRFSALTSGGVLTSGTYQFAIRYYNRNNYRYSAWSLFTHPIPAIADTNNTTSLLGGLTGQNTGKKIDLEVFGDPDNYDTFQVAVIKNNTGDVGPQSVCFLLPMMATSGSNVQAYSYTGFEAETELPLSEIVVEPANIKTAKTWNQKDLRALPGNIEYNDRRIQDTECTFDTAYTKIFPTNLTAYNNGEVAERYGHFRGELYRYGIVCQDENGLWGQVKPLDLSQNSLGRSLYRLATINPTTGATLPAYGIISSIYDAVTESVSVSLLGNVVSDFPVGALVKIDVSGTLYVYRVALAAFALGNTLVALSHAPSAPPSFAGATLQKCLGDEYNHAESIDWLYPARDVPFAALIAGGTANNLGLRIEGLTDFPTWAKAFAIVRRPRIKNILGQTPHIPLVACQGVVTPGKNVVTNDDYNEVNDTLMPKIFRIGQAANLARYDRLLEDAAGLPNYQTIQQIAWTRQQAGVESGLQASPRGVVLAHPDFVYNNDGQPFGGFDIPANAVLRPVDMVVFTSDGLRFNVPDGSNFSKEVLVYRALQPVFYYYQGNGLQYQKYNSGAWVDIRYANLLDTEPITLAGIQSQYPILNTTPIVNGNALQALPYTVFPLSTQLQNVIRFGGQTDLSQQQIDSGINQIPATNRIQFGNEVQVQRSLLAHLNIALPDATAIIATQELALLYKVFSTSSGASANMSATSFLNFNLASRWGTSSFNNTPVPILVSNAFDPVNDDAGYALILNIEAGLGLDRYGDPEAAQVWQLASDVVTIDPAGSGVYDVDILGGDCFIARSIYKVNNGIARPVPYATISGSTGLDFDLGIAAKTGSQLDMVEVLDLYVESEVDARYFGENSRYPYAQGSLSNYDQTWFYFYNGGFSAQQNQKVFANPDLRDKVNNRFPSRFLISDQKVYQTNIEGFNVYRVNSFFDLDEQFGALTKLVKRTDDVLLAVQEYAVRAIPVNENIITQQDGSPLGVATNVYIPEKVVRYITTQYGCQHLNGVIPTELGVAMIDARNRAFLLLGDNVNLLSAKGVQGVFDTLLNTNDPIPQDRLNLFYDIRQKEAHVLVSAWTDNVYTSGVDTGNITREGKWMVYSGKYDAFKTRLTSITNSDTDAQLFGVSAGGGFYQLFTNGMKVFAGVMFVDANNKGVIDIGGSIQASSFESIFVGEDYTEKVFDVMLLNTNKPITAINCESEFDGVNSFATGISAEVTPRNGLYYVNQLRNDGNMARLRGKFLRAVFIIDNNPSQDIVVNGVSVKYRKSHRVR